MIARRRKISDEIYILLMNISHYYSFEELIHV